ncbi:hypothetical protein M885DRAFT_514816 [Pelagophyceae sp. CCMP2097]|nr:hypothetical protein M885DRAFT_514816 [Pelagophyceae sp. CCMP2097]|mmetsp:Transcript_12480/g.41627  ORF Transcript_12480/g.41627 Transcript_12480/m.41627 type:complete len:243 (+) Transcript_12480:80-808(+)
MRGLTYWLGKTLYVSCTNRARGLSLVASRGPGFLMPDSSAFSPLEAEPTVDDLVAAVLDAYAFDARKKELGADVGRTTRADGGELDSGLVFAGLGEPLLRWRCVAEATRRIRLEHESIPIRLNTNALPLVGDDAAEMARLLSDAGLNAASVSLNAADAAAYAALMLRPPDHDAAYHSSREDAIGDVSGASFAVACSTIVAFAEAGIQVSATAVERPGVDVAAVRTLAFALGAVEFKARSWFP